MGVCQIILGFLEVHRLNKLVVFFQILIIVIAVTSLFIIPHEMGHFFAAKICGITPKRFAIGMGKKLFSKNHKGTEYSLRLLPIGGFVDIDDKEGSAFEKLSIHRKLFILLSGVLMNFITGAIIGLIMVLFFTPLTPTMQIAEIEQNLITYNEPGKLQNEDEILSVNGIAFSSLSEMNYYLALTKDNDFSFEVKRDAGVVLINGIELPQATGETTYYYFPGKMYGQEATVMGKLKYFTDYTTGTIKTIFLSLKKIISGQVQISQMSSIVGVGAAIQENINEGASSILELLMLLAFNIGIINLVPIPALDGGQAAILLVERVTRRHIAKKVLQRINLGCMAVMISFSLFIMGKDVLNIFLH